MNNAEMDDYRQITGQERHWLVDSRYGRDVLMARLAQKFPNTSSPAGYSIGGLDSHLNQIVLELGLHHLPKPQTKKQRFKYMKFIVALGIAITHGSAFPVTPTAW